MAILVIILFKIDNNSKLVHWRKSGGGQKYWNNISNYRKYSKKKKQFQHPNDDPLENRKENDWKSMLYHEQRDFREKKEGRQLNQRINEENSKI